MYNYHPREPCRVEVNPPAVNRDTSALLFQAPLPFSASFFMKAVKNAALRGPILEYLLLTENRTGPATLLLL